MNMSWVSSVPRSHTAMEEYRHQKISHIIFYFQVIASKRRIIIIIFSPHLFQTHEAHFAVSATIITITQFQRALYSMNEKKKTKKKKME